MSSGTEGVLDSCWDVFLVGVKGAEESALKLGKEPSLSWISWYRSSMGAPLLSDKVTPSCRRWSRAWLESPRRVSKYVPQTSHITGIGVACESMAADNAVG